LLVKLLVREPPGLPDPFLRPCIPLLCNAILNVLRMKRNMQSVNRALYTDSMGCYEGEPWQIVLESQPGSSSLRRGYSKYQSNLAKGGIVRIRQVAA